MPARSSSFCIVAVIAASVVFGSACETAYTRGEEDPRYGDPNTLEGKLVPGPRGTFGGGDGDGGGACTPDKYIDGTNCTVSFSKDIFPNMASTAAWQCASEQGCHGGKNPGAQPAITTDSKTTWENFRNFKNIDQNRPYINPCSGEPATSTFLCNITQGEGSCGKVMPLTPGAPVDAQAKLVIETWIKCGAPNN